MPPVPIEELVTKFVAATRESIKDEGDPDPHTIAVVTNYLVKILEAAQDGTSSSS